jgi:predicted nucleic acid-binding protein
MSGRVLIDTSVWIAYFQTNAPAGVLEKVDELLSDGDIQVPKIVLAELIQGAHSEKDLEVIRAFVEAFTIISESAGTWLEAGRLSFALKKKGKTINLADCYIAILAKEHKCSVLTLDKHFKEIQKETGLKMLSV